MDENMVENEQLQSVTDDTAQATTAESEENGIVSLSALLDRAVEESEGTPAETQDTEPAQQNTNEKVNGGIKGRLMAENKKGYDAGFAAAQKEWQAKEAEYQAQLQRLNDYDLREKAELIAKEQNVTPQIAMFLAKNGFEPNGNTENAAQTQITPPRDNNGRFVSPSKPNAQPSVDERANVLYEQSQNIRRMTGMNALELYKKADYETQGKIARGEMDLYDLIRETKTGTEEQRTAPNIRTNASQGSSSMRFGRLSDTDIDKLNDYLRKGGVVNGDL